jgi:4-amino-4-deoxy-L-arabinose transferase-like glycosyltransferase
MRKFISVHWVFIFSFILLTVFLFSGRSEIPFHPDESTHLYMSQDIDLYLRNRAQLFFNIQNDDDSRQRYRLIDAPLTRYILGVGRSIMGLSPLESDWDWSRTWAENIQSNAMPSNNLLQAGRTSMTLLLLLSTILIYFVGFHIGGQSCGLAAAVLLGFNALALIHGRRAMSEGALIFGITLFLFSLINSTKLPWLTGLGMALAFNTKHSTIPLIVVGLLAVSWVEENSTNLKSKVIRNVALYLGIFLLITIALNPVFWHQPINALQSAIFERQQLLNQQVNDTQMIMPDRVLDDYVKRTAALIANLFILPPSVADVGNYTENTASSELKYLSNPLNNLLRGTLGGGIVMLLTLFGISLAGIHTRTLSSNNKKTMILLLLATILQGFGLLIFVPLPWQRYVIPLVPFISLWAACGLGYLINASSDQIQKMRFKTNRGTP